MSARVSGLQRDVLSLYRLLLRAARAKDPARVNVGLVVRQQFRERALGIARNDFQQIEHWLRYGHKQIKVLEESTTIGETTTTRPK